MEEVGTAKLMWGAFCTVAGAAIGAYFGLSTGLVGAIVGTILGAAGGSIVAFNPLGTIAALLKLL